MVQWVKTLPKWLLLELVIPLTILNGWLLFQAFQTFQPLLSIVIVASLLSFLLDYPVQLLEKRGIQRGYAILAILLATLITLIICGLTLIPLLVSQLSELATRLPVWIESGDEQFAALDTWLTAQHIPLSLSEVAAQFSKLLPDELKALPNQLLELVLGAADRLIEAIIILALTVYLLLHGNTFWGGILQWLPQGWGDRIQQATREQFRNYFLGQATVATLMALALTVVFFLLKIPFWLVFGLGIGLSVLIPFGDVVGILVVSSLVSLKSIWLGGEVLAIAIITDQIIDNAVAPRILSNLVGLNPVWVIISLLVGAQLGGVLGIVIAVPLAASIKQIFEQIKSNKDESLPHSQRDRLGAAGGVEL